MHVCVPKVPYEEIDNVHLNSFGHWELGMKNDVMSTI